MVVAAVQPPGERVAEREREAHAERAGGHLDAGRLLHDGVALELAAELAERHQVFDREVAGLGQRPVDHRRGVALADDEAVAVGPEGVLRVVAHDAEVERGGDLDGGEGAAGVAGVGGGDHLHDVPADALRDGLQFVDGNGLGAGQALLLPACIIPNRTLRFMESRSIAVASQRRCDPMLESRA